MEEVLICVTVAMCCVSTDGYICQLPLLLLYGCHCPDRNNHSNYCCTLMETGGGYWSSCSYLFMVRITLNSLY